MSSAHDDRADTPGAATRARRLAIGTLDRLLPGENPAGAVYGTITVGALLAAESSLRDTYPETIGAVVVALLVYWLAHSYAELLGQRLAAGERLTVSGLGRALGRDWAIVRGAGAPVLALLVAWAVGASQETGVTVGLWTCVASLRGVRAARGAARAGAAGGAGAPVVHRRGDGLRRDPAAGDLALRRPSHARRAARTTHFASQPRGPQAPSG